MKFEQLYSGSSGNLYLVTAATGERLIIDPGVTWLKLQKALKYDLTGIVAAYVTHEHLDHCKSVKKLIEAGIDVYCSHGTAKALEMLDNRRIKVIANKTLVKLAPFEIFSFDVHHDAAEPLGFAIRDKSSSEYLLFATDSCHIMQRFKVKFNIIAIECSFDKDILQERVDSGLIHEALAKRLLTSHMEKASAMRYLDEFCDLSICRQIHLLHMSDENCDKEKTRKEFEHKFFIDTKVI